MADAPERTDRLLRTKKVAAMFGVSVRTVERWRDTNDGPPFIRVGGSVLYRESTCREFLRKREFLD